MQNPVFGSPMQNPVCGPLQNLVHQPMWNPVCKPSYAESGSSTCVESGLCTYLVCGPIHVGRPGSEDLSSLYFKV